MGLTGLSPLAKVQQAAHGGQELKARSVPPEHNSWPQRFL